MRGEMVGDQPYWGRQVVDKEFMADKTSHLAEVSHPLTFLIK